MMMSRPSTASRFRLEEFGKRRIDDGGADIGEQAEILAQSQQPRLRPRFVRHFVPFRPADSAEDHGIGGVSLGHGLVGNGDLVRVIAGTADKPFLGLEIGDTLLGVEAKQPFHLGHDFGTDAVASEKQKLEVGMNDASWSWLNAVIPEAERNEAVRNPDSRRSRSCETRRGYGFRARAARAPE